ncbi:LacI family DNA-binding transcriptional regulator [Mahella australiensis]|uniref:Transcriptional regulator, LacI family n=1 Tax=Mahella australiensis (strain DSM 15567 / CIP 107919 / 50-1 BON) TaxID=697281 RepID=F4A0Q3_MAHA5|nr:LacI family DNA-binding transcriptional regulator [Mahella australiensis]AEE96949.1 transcriptional regulator, LacI family [Mahella australiensis 50-1 BON]
MVTIKDISKKANVSIATVSKVLNGDYSRVSEATKEKILKIAREMNYVPNRLARGLVSNHTHILGLIVSDITNPFFAEMAKGVEDKAAKCGYNVILCNTDDDMDREAAYINVLLQYNVDGVIITSSAISDNQHILKLRDSNTPFVAIDRYIDDDTYSVFLDNFKGSYIATEYIIKKGHKRIAYIGGDVMLKIPNQRLEGYYKALGDYGMERDEKLVRIGTYHVESGYNDACALLDSGCQFTAVVCGNDLIALGVARAIKEHDLRIPDDISIIGYDNIYLSTLMDPPLTTIKQPIYDMGDHAVDVIIRLINGEQINEKIHYFIPELVERQSVRQLMIA